MYYDFATMFGDGLNELRRNSSAKLVGIKKTDQGYTISVLLMTIKEAMEDGYFVVNRHAEALEYSVWTVNPDGSLNDKLATFFKPLKE